ncbi:MAG TPA: BrnA antitoxin family protein [Acetobacteraceae bacterium]|jgi:uncharacterized protein (DUF4415 family)|nr:BrnA antitoxin family protein [Acetobacteraceae bacterium]
MPSNRRPKNLPTSLHWPTDEEEADIQRGIARDPDNPEWTEEDFARALPASAVMPPEFMAEHAKPHRGRQKEPTKVLVSLRLDRDVIDRLKAGGRGWQTRANALLRRAVRARRSG